MNTVRWLVRPLSILWLVCLLAGTAAACPTCKEALAGTEGAGDIINGYFYSIMFMVSMPFTILGGFGVCAYRAVNKAKATGMYDEANYMPRRMDSLPPQGDSQVPSGP